MFTLVNAAGNVQKIAKDARRRDELIRKGYTEVKPEPEAKPAKAPRKKTDDKE